MKKINSGINLFKLFSMFMIVVLHIIGRGGVVYNVVGARFSAHIFAEHELLRRELLCNNNGLSDVWKEA